MLLSDGRCQDSNRQVPRHFSKSGSTPAACEIMCSTNSFCDSFDFTAPEQCTIYSQVYNEMLFFHDLRSEISETNMLTAVPLLTASFCTDQATDTADVDSLLEAGWALGSECSTKAAAACTSIFLESCAEVIFPHLCYRQLQFDQQHHN